jgi:uncharacterized protein
VQISLKLLSRTFALCKVENIHDITTVLRESNPCVLVRSSEEISVLCEESLLPSETTAMSSGWKLLKFTGTADDGLIGIVGAITKPLADSGISVLANTSYDAGYFGVQISDLDRAIDVLERNDILVSR